jgi:hypothetical protein
MRYILFPLLIFASIAGKSQVCIKGLVLENTKTLRQGDTLTFCGAYENPKEKNLYYRMQKSGRMVSSSVIRLLYDEIDFWDLQQFYYTSNTISSKGWQLEKRKQLEEETLTYLAKLESENKILHDKYAEDFLQQLLQNIHSPKIWKGRDQFLNVKILNTDQKICYAFDNGSILISSQLLADLKTEKELIRILSEAVAHILLDSNLDNLDSQSDSELRQLGAIYSGYSKKRVQLIVDHFINVYEKKYSPAYHSDFEFTNALAGIISYTAWQEFYSNHYQIALDYLNRLNQYKIENSTDFLLRAKIYMKIINTSEANQEAIRYLKKAASFNDQELPEIFSELGVALLREEQYSEARQYFLKYYELVLKMANEEKMKWALKMINICDVHLKGSEENRSSDI